MLEQDLHDALASLVGGRVFPDVAPMKAALPYITYSQVGGSPSNTLCGNTNRLNARMQFNVWSKTRKEAVSIMLSAESILTSPPLRGVSQGEMFYRYEEPVELYGCQQDISFWR